MDNACIHRAKFQHPLNTKINFFFNAPYSPFLYPIEELFALINTILGIDRIKIGLILFIKFNDRYIKLQKNNLRVIFCIHFIML